MSGNRDNLISGLVAELEPVPRPGKIGRPVLSWVVVASAVSIGLMLARGPFRPGFAQQLLEHLRFAIESSVGVVAIIALTIAAYRSAIPRPRDSLALVSLPFALAALWAAFYVYGLHDPALPGSMAGKRGHCYVEVLLVGLPCLAIGIFGLRSFYPLHPTHSGALLGLAAGIIPALAMQFACMYIPEHILSHHVLPGFVLGIVGALAGRVLLKQK